jgi:AcrR family transcriptional regulator
MGNDETREEKRDAIIEAALKAYALYGINGTKLQYVADLAGIGKSTIYEYFQSKEDLEQATVNKIMFDMSSESAEMYKMIESNPTESLSKVIDNILNFPYDKPEVFNFYIQLYLKSSEKGKYGFSNEFKEIIKQVVIPIKFLLKKGIEKGEFKKHIDIETLAYLIGIMADGLGFFSMVYKDREMVNKMGEEIKRMIFLRLGVDYDKAIEE